MIRYSQHQIPVVPYSFRIPPVQIHIPPVQMNTWCSRSSTKTLQQDQTLQIDDGGPEVNSTPSTLRANLKFHPPTNYSCQDSELDSAFETSEEDYPIPPGSLESQTDICKSDLRIDENGDNDSVRNVIGRIQNFKDAYLAGTADSDCSLILSLGTASLSLAAAGLSLIGREKYGLYVIKNHPMNASELTSEEIKNNPLVNNILTILGLQFEYTYETKEERKTLRYSNVIFMMDEGEEGYTMKRFIVNLFHRFWPSLLKINFLKDFITPIVKIKYFCHSCCCKHELLFYTIEEYEAWKENSNWTEFAAKDYRSLGNFTAQEVKDHFSRFLKPCSHCRYEVCEDCLERNCPQERSYEELEEWLSPNMNESFPYEDLKDITYENFIDEELLLDGDSQKLRPFPCENDEQTLSKRKLYFEEEGDSLHVGSVFTVHKYARHMDSFRKTVMEMLHSFIMFILSIISTLIPISLFGTLAHKKKASEKNKYNHSSLKRISKENGMFNEQIDYRPHIPLIICNTNENIGPGWRIKIFKYDVENIKSLVRLWYDFGPERRVPSATNFKGAIIVDDDYYYSYGKATSIDTIRQPRITELPVDIRAKENTFNAVLGKLAYNPYSSYGTKTGIENSQLRITNLPTDVWAKVASNFKFREKEAIVDYDEQDTDTSDDFSVTHRTHNPVAIAEESLYEVLHIMPLLGSRFIIRRLRRPN